MKKIAIITGTGRGIGKALAKLLLNKGYIVFGYSRTNQIKNKNFTFIKIDLSNLNTVQKIKFPKINLPNTTLLINNAATIGEILPLNKKSESKIIKEYNLNIVTPALLCKKFIEAYQEHFKIIINIGSGASNKSIASWNIYCSAKSALDRLTCVIAEEKHHNLNIFSVHPGIVNTEMQKKIRNANKKYFPMLDNFIDYYKNNALKNTEEIAKKVYYIIQNKEKLSQNIISLRDIKIK